MDQRYGMNCHDIVSVNDLFRDKEFLNSSRTLRFSHFSLYNS